MMQFYKSKSLVGATLIILCHFLAVGQSVSLSVQPALLNPVSGFTVYADCAVDMDGNQLDDVVRVGAKGIYLDFQGADGQFTQKFYPTRIENPPVWSVCAGDLDNNGLCDLLFGGAHGVSFLMANNDGSQYAESISDAQLFAQRSTIIDINNDGWLDAYVCNDTSMSVAFSNQGLGTMLADPDLLSTSPRPGSYSAIWTDYDNDYDPDLYISKCLSGAAPGDPNRDNLLYRNNGDGSFSEVADLAGLRDNDQSWSTVFEDFDNDGDMDAFIVNHQFQNRLLKNEDGMFTDVTADSGIDGADLGAFECTSGDFNNDGFIDIFSELQHELYLGHGDLTFSGQDLPTTPGAIADLNSDGFLDVLKNGLTWLNDGNGNHWLKVNLIGLTSNRNGIGARLEIYGPWGIQIREVRSGQSYSPMNTLTTHFGLGQETAVDSLRVQWPSGTSTLLKNPSIDTTYLIPEWKCMELNAGVTVLRQELCAGDTLEISAPTGFERHIWTHGDTNRTIRISTPGRYTALTENNEGCIAVTNDVIVTLAQETVPSLGISSTGRNCQGDSIVLTVLGGQNPVWSNGWTEEQLTVTLPGSYSVSVDAKCSDNQLTSHVLPVEFLPAPSPVESQITIATGDSVLLSVKGENCHWFSQEENGELLHVGCDFWTPQIFTNQTYFVENRPYYSGEIQEGGKMDTTSGGSSEQTGFLAFEAWQPFVLSSVQVFLPMGVPAGIRFVQLISGDSLLAFQSFQVEPGWNELELNFNVPVGTHALHCPQGNLFRDLGPQIFPYPIGDVGRIVNSSFGSEYYYYFYNWKIQTEDKECISKRVPIQVITTAHKEPERTAVHVYPNPTFGMLNIRLSGNPLPGDARLSDTHGIILKQWQFSESQPQQIELGELAPGIYWLQLRLENELITRKIMVL